MPVVIKRDETGKGPKDKKAAASTSASAPKATPKPASATAKTKNAGVKGERNELPKVIIAVSVILAAVIFFVWYMFLSGGQSTPTEVANQNRTDRPPAAATKPGGVPNLGKGLGGLSTDEGAPAAGKGGPGKTEGTEAGGEGIP
jgi:hypothetical protein